MHPCRCHKATYPSAARAYQALTALQRRPKRRRHSKNRIMHLPGQQGRKITVYKCPAGCWHHGHEREGWQ
jgi:hypothetical protein